MSTLDFGLKPEGFTVPRAADFLTYIRDNYEERTSLDIDWESDVFLGNITAIQSVVDGKVADAVKAAADSFDPQNATGKALDNLCILVGITRRPATFGQVFLTVIGEQAGDLVPAGIIAEGGGENNDARWITQQDSTLVEAALSTGDLTFVAPAGGVKGYIERTTGSWILDGVGPGAKVTITGSANNNQTFTVTENSSTDIIYVRETVTAEGAVAATATVYRAVVVAQAMQRGQILAGSAEIDAIVSSPNAIKSVLNPAKAEAGQDQERDSDLRRRRAESLQIAGAGSVKALRANLRKLKFLTDALVIENTAMTSAVVEGFTLNAKSYRPIVWPATLTDSQKEDILLTIYSIGPAGIEVDASDVTGTVTGADGYSKDVAFDYASTVSVNVNITLTLQSNISLSQVESIVETSVQRYFENLGVGDDVLQLKLCGVLSGLPGIISADVLLDGGSGDVAISAAEIAEIGTLTVV